MFDVDANGYAPRAIQPIPSDRFHMKEGHVFRASWRRDGPQFIVEALELKDVVASGRSFAEADRRLGYEIGMATGDGENVREYTTAPPDESAFSSDTGDAYRWLGFGFAELASARNLFTGGYCSACLTPLGERTAVPLTVAKVNAGAQGARARLPHCSSTGPTFTIVSAPVLDRLRILGGAEFEARTARVRRAKAEWFELRPTRVPLRYVGYRDQEMNEVECSTCGTLSVGPKASAQMLRCVARDSAQGRPVVFMGEPEHAILAVEEQRWYEMSADPLWREVKTTRVEAIDEADIGHAAERLLRPPLNPRLIELALGVGEREDSGG